MHRRNLPCKGEVRAILCQGSYCRLAIIKNYFATLVVLTFRDQGVLVGSAGSLWAARSSPSQKPSPSRSTPMRSPEPGGAQVNVIVRLPCWVSDRSAASVIAGDARRSVLNRPE